jgi:hypothetical protein
MPLHTGTLAALALLLALAVTAAGAAITAYPGSVVTLAGTSTGSDTVYLFVTGPNLPADGGRLESPDTPVRSGDAGTFTTAAVGAGDRWTYRWRTGGAGLDPGTYTVYVVDAPVDRSDLSGHAYTTISVTLGIPPDTPVTEAATPTLMPPTAPAATTVAPSPTPTAAAPAAVIFPVAVAMLVAALLAWR